MDLNEQQEIIVNMGSDYYVKMCAVSFLGSATAYLLVTFGIGYLAKRNREKENNV